jgi:hypothetical protein
MKRLMIAIFLILISTNTLPAFEVQDITGNGGFRKWNLSAGPVSITLNSQGSEDLPLSRVESEIQSALGAWRNAGVNLQYAGTSSEAVVNSSDQINSILWAGNDWRYSSSTLAMTLFTYYLTDPPEMVDADIIFNARDFRWTAGQQGDNSVDFQMILLHELGHLIGLSHSSVFKSSLYPYLKSTISHKLENDDKTGARFLYGSPITDFVAITPVPNANYVTGMATKSLPLPVFRWGNGSNSNFTLEFSPTSSFARKITIAAGANNHYSLKGSDERELLALSGTKKVYWRISTGTTKTAPRPLLFRAH